MFTIDGHRTVARVGNDHSLASGFFPAWSPDGAELAFLSPLGRLVVMRADGSRRRTLTRFPIQQRPAWSPDGSRIAFGRRGDLFSILAEGGGLRRFTRTKRPEGEPAWSPDGRHVAFTAAGGIWLMDADGEHLRKLAGAIGSAPPGHRTAAASCSRAAAHRASSIPSSG